MFELVIYKGKQYFASVFDLYIRKEEIILDTIEYLGNLSEDFNMIHIYNAVPTDVIVVSGEDVKDIIKTGKYFLYKEYLDGFGDKSVYIDGTELLFQMEQYAKEIQGNVLDVNPESFVAFVHFHKDEIETEYEYEAPDEFNKFVILHKQELALAFEFKQDLKRLEDYKKELEEGNDNG